MFGAMPKVVIFSGQILIPKWVKIDFWLRKFNSLYRKSNIVDKFQSSRALVQDVRPEARGNTIMRHLFYFIEATAIELRQRASLVPIVVIKNETPRSQVRNTTVFDTVLMICTK